MHIKSSLYRAPCSTFTPVSHKIPLGSVMVSYRCTGVICSHPGARQLPTHCSVCRFRCTGIIWRRSCARLPLTENPECSYRCTGVICSHPGARQLPTHCLGCRLRCTGVDHFYPRAPHTGKKANTPVHDPKSCNGVLICCIDLTTLLP